MTKVLSLLRRCGGWGTLICLLLAPLAPTLPVHAQEQSVYYWNFPTAGRLQHLLPVDVDGDGVAELAVVAENGRVDLIDANGLPRWSYEIGAPVLALAAINSDDVLQAGQEIAVALANELLLFSARGELLWRVPLEAAAPPPTLLMGGGAAALAAWQAQYAANPVAIAPFDHDGNGRGEILVLLRSGQLQLFDARGARLWRFARNNNPTVDASPHLVVDDFDGNGRQEALVGYFNPSSRFSRLVWVQGDGTPRWERPVDGRITTMLSWQPPESATPNIAVGTSLGNVNLYSATGQRIWPRTINRPVSALTLVPLPDAPGLRGGYGLAVGSSSGSVYVFDSLGRRHLTAHLDPEAGRRVLALSAGAGLRDASLGENWPTLAAVLGPQVGQPGPTDLVLLDSDGRILQTFTGIDETGLSQMLDLNQDGISELLLVQFPDLSLLGLGVGASEVALEWSRVLRAVPLSYLVVDFNQDGVDELLVGDDDGRLHRFDNEGSLFLRIVPGGKITHLAALPGAGASEPRIVLARTSSDNGGLRTGVLEVRRENGEQVWAEGLPAPITSLLVGDVNGRDQPEIIVGTEAGNVALFSAEGARLADYQFSGPVRQLLTLPAADPMDPVLPELVVVQEFELFKIRLGDAQPTSIAAYPEAISAVYVLPQPAAATELATRLLVLVADGRVYGLNWRGVLLPPWPIALDGAPVFSYASPPRTAAAGTTLVELLIATDDSTLLNLSVANGRPQIQWRVRGVGSVVGVQVGDLDGDAQPNVAIANRDRSILLFTQEPELTDELLLSSTPFGLAALRQSGGQKSDLVAITDNGLVQLFRAQENRPPLLTNPTVDVRPGQYNLTVSVRDVEEDPVTVRLEMFDPGTGRWEAQAERLLNTGNGQVPFIIPNPVLTGEGVRYRFFFADGFHNGYLTPPSGPRPLVVAPLVTPAQLILGGLTLLLGISAVLLIRQAQSTPDRARRFHRRLRQHPAQTLRLLESRYAFNGGSSEFLLYLTSQARQGGDWLVASLADGLFLLADRPHAALSILNGALDEAVKQELAWECLPRWRMMFKTGQALLEAPSLTELTLLHPQLVALLHLLEETDQWSPTLEMLLPALTNLRDSERVEMVEDRLVYLNEAGAQLTTLEEQFPEFADRIEKTLARAVARRWLGLIVAEREELRGRAELVVTLKTRRLLPNTRAQLAVEIHNNGRAAAEQVLAVLEERPSYDVYSPPQIIPLIPPGRALLASFEIEPQVSDRFRIALNLTYNDRNQQDKVAAFGDMVHVLAPARDFKPIANPYIPGSPLRRESPMFYGRRELFNFIAENVGEQAQRNVLILVGQRRTGKTSALLQLEQHLPPNLIPVYIDCQSLGVTPGIGALLNDLAWLIADALLSRDIEVQVPETAVWQEDPTGHFQRKFLPYVQALLPAQSTLLLVFDEFEAIENLVQDDILPATIFPYLRHLMQHSPGLSFIFVGTRRLEEMGADYWSVLFNIALYQKIGYLSPESAARLVTEPVAPNLVYDDLALDKILRVTAGHPYFLQLVCYTLVKRANAQKTGYITISDVNAALDEMLRLGEVHFAYLWQRSDYTEKALLTAVAHLMDPDQPFHPEDIIQALQPYDINLDPGAVTAALQSLEERDIMREITEQAKTLYELRVGLVGLWVAQNKSLTKLLYAGG